MPLTSHCPRCASPAAGDDAGWRCPDHGAVTPLWRPTEATYESFLEHLERCRAMPTMLPWPLSPGWSVTDFGCVAHPGTEPQGTLLTCTGAADGDGPIELTLVAEEAGVGLGACCARIQGPDPGPEVGEGAASVRVRIDGHPVPLWTVFTSGSDPVFDRSVFAGEARGRWLWLILRPPTAALLLEDEWILCDVADLGPELVEIAFGGEAPSG